MDEKDLKEIKEIFVHHIGILVEDFQHKLDIVVEGNQILNDKIDNVQEGLIDLTTRVDMIDLRTLNLEQGQKRLEQRQERLEQRQERLEQRQERLEQRQERLEQRQERLEQRQERLEHRQGKLEHRQSNLEDEIKKVRVDLCKRIDNIATELAEHRADTESHLSRV